MGLADDVRHALDDLAERISLVSLGGMGAPQRVGIALTTPDATRTRGHLGHTVTNLLPGGLRPLAKLPATVPVPIDLAFVTKNVTFGTPQLPAPRPGTDLLDGSVIGEIVGSRVSGTIGRVAGTVAVPVGELVERVGEALKETVELDLVVRVRDEAGAEMAGARIGLGAERPEVASTVEVRGEPANALPQIVVQIPVPFVELSSELPAVRATVSVSVRLSVALQEHGTVQTDVIELPGLTLSVPAIPVPVLAVFFSQRNFNRDDSGRPRPLSASGGAGEQVQLYLFTPDRSPLPDPRDQIDALLAPLDTLEQTLSVLDLAPLVLGAAGLAPVTNALRTVRSVPRDVDLRTVVCLVKADQVRNWWDTFVTYDTFLGLWHDTAEDKIQSLALLAPPTRALDLFEHDDYQGSWLTVRTRTPTASDPRALLTLVARLDVRTAPASDPPGQVVRRRGGEFMHQRISSSRWTPAT